MKKQIVLEWIFAVIMMTMNDKLLLNAILCALLVDRIIEIGLNYGSFDHLLVICRGLPQE